MKNSICVLFILSTSIFYAQKKDNSPFVLDSVFHNRHVNNFIDDLKTKNIDDLIYVSDYNFVSNDTYIIWKYNGTIKGRIISNKKTRTRIKNKKLCLKKEMKKKISSIFNNGNNYDYLSGFDNCESELPHFYYLGVTIQDKRYVINSKCIPELKKDTLTGIGYLVELIGN